MIVRVEVASWFARGALCAAVVALSFPTTAQASSEADQPSTAPSTEAARQTCSTPLLTQAPSSVDEWLIRTMLASHCYEYQARAVSINSIGVRTLALSHRVQDGVRQQVVQHLDGPSISVERRSQAGKLAWALPGESDFDIAVTPRAWAEHVETYYDVSLENEERVAGRVASRLRFEPHDDNRYAHTWWVDEETGLLLKHELSDTQSRVVETFQMTQLQSPSLYEGPLMSEQGRGLADPDWEVNWLPAGFVAQPAQITSSNPMPQRFFSDGLSSVSVFAAPAGDEALEAGAYTLGVSGIAIELVDIEGERWQLVAIGELPAGQVRRIVQSIEFGAHVPGRG
ncbi:MucB/RseB C-terminal domain-containing protein [Halomonas sp. PAMB 3264]|uniref:MucB/RseB C-terminal domain-containing protein n=1 Tax=Halomonas sp. PAMB 3264 TaxID=3075222 RepID=UPI0028A22AE7|nr:MucB/RseB C-terminal domain-containing protein [Halomonas sp. PAMB 3264]WNL40794.1 MucB/RseB C-terminal domain-containing protein [Halomonas sp. PAMB 3264]